MPMGKQAPLAEPEPLSMEQQLDLKDRELFLNAWGLREESLTDEEILMATKLGHL